MSKNIEMQVLGESGYETIYPVVTTVLEQNKNLQQKFWRGTQAEYDAILDRAYKGEIILVDEIKQFDAANSCFLVFVRYDEVMYKLHPRFNYLRGE